MNHSARWHADRLADAIEDIATLIGEYSGRCSRLNSGQTIVAGLDQIGDATLLRRRVGDIRQGFFTLVVVGKFKHGKSTLINAILGRDLVHTRAIPTTAIITVIVHGSLQKVAIHWNSAARPSFISWQEFIRDYSLAPEDADSASGDRYADVDYAQIDTEHPFLAQGIKLVDSPGIGEDEVRNETVKRFLKHAQAVVFVLNAQQLLGELERLFIRQELGEGRLEHAFFVVNRVNQVDPNEIGELDSRLKQVLAPHFAGRDGRFDERFFRRRVYFIDAKGALTAHQQHPVDERALQRSGLTHLETEISNLVTGADRIPALLSSSVQALTVVLAESSRRIERQRIAMRESLEDLRRRHIRAERALADLRSRREEILSLFRQRTAQLNLKAESDLMSYIEENAGNWNRDSERFLPLSSVKMIDLLQCPLNEQVKSRMLSGIQLEAANYVRQLLSGWSKRLQALVAAEMAIIEKKTKHEVCNFQQALNEMQDNFAAGRSIVAANDDCLVFAGFSIESSGPFEKTGDWERMIGFSIAALYGILVLYIAGLFTPAALVAAVIAALGGVNPLRIVPALKDRIRRKVGTSIFTELRNDRSLYGTISGRLNDSLEEMSKQIGGLLRNQINEADRHMQRILNKKTDSDFDAEREVDRLEQVAQLLEQRFKELNAMVLKERVSSNEVPILK